MQHLDGTNAQLRPTAQSGKTFSSPWKSRMHPWRWPSEGALNRDAPGLLRQRRWAGSEQKLGPAARATAIETLQIQESGTGPPIHRARIPEQATHQFDAGPFTLRQAMQWVSWVWQRIAPEQTADKQQTQQQEQNCVTPSNRWQWA